MANVVFPDGPAVRDRKLEVRAFAVEQVNVEIVAPAVLFERDAVVFCGSAGAAVCGVALYDGAADFLHDGTPELRTQEVFVAELAGMYLNGNVAGQLAIEQLIHFNDLFRGDRFCKINLGFHENSSLEFVICGNFPAYISVMYHNT